MRRTGNGQPATHRRPPKRADTPGTPWHDPGAQQGLMGSVLSSPLDLRQASQPGPVSPFSHMWRTRGPSAWSKLAMKVAAPGVPPDPARRARDCASSAARTCPAAAAPIGHEQQRFIRRSSHE